MDDGSVRAFNDTLKGELLSLKQSIARIEKAMNGEVITRQHLERLIGPTGRRATKSKIDRDPEVREFLYQQLAEARGTITEIAERMQEKFGKTRAPSASATHTYVRRLRQEGVLNKVRGK